MRGILFFNFANYDPLSAILFGLERSVRVRILSSVSTKVSGPILDYASQSVYIYSLRKNLSSFTNMKQTIFTLTSFVYALTHGFRISTKCFYVMFVLNLYMM